MYNKCAASQAVCFKAFWLVSRSLSERVPNVSRSCSERLRSKALSECFLTGYKGGAFRKVMYLYKQLLPGEVRYIFVK